jgi:hypothetical protein
MAGSALEVRLAADDLDDERRRALAALLVEWAQA